MYMLAYMLLLSSRCMLCVVYTPRQVYAVLLSVCYVYALLLSSRCIL